MTDQENNTPVGHLLNSWKVLGRILKGHMLTRRKMASSVLLSSRIGALNCNHRRPTRNSLLNKQVPEIRCYSLRMGGGDSAVENFTNRTG